MPIWKLKRRIILYTRAFENWRKIELPSNHNGRKFENNIEIDDKNDNQKANVDTSFGKRDYLDDL